MKPPCQAKRCRNEMSVIYCFGSTEFRLCDNHNVAFCNTKGTLEDVMKVLGGDVDGN